MNSNDYIDGMADCEAGKPADTKRSADYTRGYGVQYAAEQIASELSRKGARK